MRGAFAQLQLFLEDLEVVQRHSEQYFPVPDELPRTERVVVRVARLLAEGHCVICPFLPEVRLALNGRDIPATRAVLEGKERSLHVSCEAFSVQIAGRRLDLGPVFVSHPQVAVVEESRGPALAALTAGHGDGVEVGLRPVDGGRFRLVLQNSPASAGTTPVPLGLPGYREPH
ncbi:hypothetical protein ACIPSE_46405 [Streptomyces sp. NPDC090106]|uniref:hypothetical protein n=1 Tax=Streptomyces sp. NPDC090106 TaxID=3365946 RepID=UPI0038080C73